MRFIPTSSVPFMRSRRVARAILAVGFVLSASLPAIAQEWTDYVSIQDGFKILFPGQPRVSATTWESEFRYRLPARVYSAEKNGERYSVTVVDYNPIEAQGIERRNACPPGAEPCIGSDLSGPGYWKHDIRGAIVFAAGKFLMGNTKLTHMLWNHQDLVEGQELQLTNPDGSRRMVFIAMHENKLYIADAQVPVGRPEPALFQNAMGWVDKDGNGIRYQTIYVNQIYGLKEQPSPSTGRGGGGGAGRQGGAGRRGGGAGPAGGGPAGAGGQGTGRGGQ